MRHIAGASLKQTNRLFQYFTPYYLTPSIFIPSSSYSSHPTPSPAAQMTVDNRQASPYKPVPTRSCLSPPLAVPTLHFFNINFTAPLRTLDPLSNSDLQFLYVRHLKAFCPISFCSVSTRAATRAAIKQSSSCVFCTWQVSSNRCSNSINSQLDATITIC